MKCRKTKKDRAGLTWQYLKGGKTIVGDNMTDLLINDLTNISAGACIIVHHNQNRGQDRARLLEDQRIRSALETAAEQGAKIDPLLEGGDTIPAEIFRYAMRLEHTYRSVKVYYFFNDRFIIE